MFKPDNPLAKTSPPPCRGRVRERVETLPPHNSTPLPNPLVRQLAIRLSPQAGKSLVIPQAGEGANESLREFGLSASDQLNVLP